MDLNRGFQQASNLNVGMPTPNLGGQGLTGSNFTLGANKPSTGSNFTFGGIGNTGINPGGGNVGGMGQPMSNIALTLAGNPLGTTGTTTGGLGLGTTGFGGNTGLTGTGGMNLGGGLGTGMGTTTGTGLNIGGGVGTGMGTGMGTTTGTGLNFGGGLGGGTTTGTGMNFGGGLGTGTGMNTGGGLGTTTGTGGLSLTGGMGTVTGTTGTGFGTLGGQKPGLNLGTGFTGGLGTGGMGTTTSTGIGGGGSLGTGGLNLGAGTTGLTGGGLNLGGTRPLTTGGLSYNPMGNTQINQFMTQSIVRPNLTLPYTNMLRFEKFNTLQVDSLKNIISKIEVDLKNNDIYIESCEKLLNKLNTEFKTFINNGSAIAKYSRLIENKNKKIKSIMHEVTNDLNIQGELLEKQKRNFTIIQNYDLKIEVPNENFIRFIREIEENIALHLQASSEIDALINIFTKKENGSFDPNSDILEDLIKNLYTNLLMVTSESSNLNDFTNSLKIYYKDLLMSQFGMKENEVDERLKKFTYKL
jgi:hypothetical protein